MSKNFLSFSEKREVAKLIETYCKKNEHGFAVYEPGWSDNHIALKASGMLSKDITAGNVAYLRNEIVGRLYGKPSTELPMLSAKVAELEKTVIELMLRMDMYEKEQTARKLSENGFKVLNPRK